MACISHLWVFAFFFFFWYIKILEYRNSLKHSVHVNYKYTLESKMLMYSDTVS